jgi:hypothetical protein
MIGTKWYRPFGSKADAAFERIESDRATRDGRTRQTQENQEKDAAHPEMIAHSD